MVKKIIPERICPQCEKLFMPSRKNKVFCSSYCRFRNWSIAHPRIRI